MFAHIAETVTFLKSKGFGEAVAGIILGTGLGNFTGEIDIIAEAGYETIPHFVTSTVDATRGRLIFGTVAGKKVLIMQGRFHYYEGYDMQQITFPVRVLKMMGIKMLLLSNIAGATGYLLKNSPPSKITEAIIDLYHGGSPMSSVIARKVIQSFKPVGEKDKEIEILTPREREMLDLLAKGYRYKEIAEKLFISFETVRTHIHHIYEKLHVQSRTEALNKAFPR